MRKRRKTKKKRERERGVSRTDDALRRGEGMGNHRGLRDARRDGREAKRRETKKGSCEYGGEKVQEVQEDGEGMDRVGREDEAKDLVLAIVRVRSVHRCRRRRLLMLWLRNPMQRRRRRVSFAPSSSVRVFVPPCRWRSVPAGRRGTVRGR